MENKIIEYKSVLSDIKQIIDSGRNSAYKAVNSVMIMTYWSIGKRIVEDEQNGEKRAGYGKKLLKTLSEELTKEYGKGFSQRNLADFRKFYLLFNDKGILQTCLQNLNWSHFRSLLRVADEDARMWYMNEAANEGWSSRTLDRNIGTQYYYRLLKSPKKDEEEKQKHMTEFHKEVAEEIDALIAPVGEYWWGYMRSWPNIEMYYKDGAHASFEGSDFAAKYIWDAIYTDLHRKK